jgi:hypothetical protein
MEESRMKGLREPDLSVRSRGNGSYTVSTSITQYPGDAQLFYIPPFPSNIKKLVEPQQLRDLPPAGYDMRTLRKQVISYLYIFFIFRLLSLASS